MSTEIYIARHGQDEDNAAGVLNGRRDTPLTELGRNQAYDLASKIAETGLIFDAVYSSPLRRALETARIVCSVLGGAVEPVIMPQLIERDFGVMTGVPITEIPERCAPNVLKAEKITYFLDPEGAETFPQLVERGHMILEQIRQARSEGNTLLVCHGDIGKMVYAAATGKAWEDVLRDFHFGNGDLIDVSPHGKAHKIQLPQSNL